MKFRCYGQMAAFAALLVLSSSCSKSGGDASGVSTGSGSTPIAFSMSPTSGPVGTLLTFTGTDFDLATVTGVTVNGTAAIIVSKARGTAQALVMPGSTTGNLVITNSSGTKNAAFTVTTVSPIAAQQGTKLVGTGHAGNAQQGISVALSADGNTALVGGYQDNSSQGAAWVFTRAGTTWTQQGTKLVGTGNTGAAQQGYSVALSADGNTALVGGYADNSNEGAAWVFTRSGTTWTQQGTKLVGTGNTGAARQGSSVALSADGNTALVGGFQDNSNQGAAWVFTRAGTTWTQQGTKLVGTGNTGAAVQGYSVTLSADGNTALVGGINDNSNQGAAWVFTRSGTTWTQQGTKLVGTGNTGAARQGSSVALSADGNTALVGGFNDNANQGAAWVFTRSSTTWTQQGTRLVGTGNTGAARQGSSVALSADGNTALVGGYQDNSQQGAAWVFTRSGTTWTQQGTKLLGNGNTGTAQQGFSVSLSADGNTALLGGWIDNSNQGAAWVWVP
ncbi:MAG: beta strand repeat-containing protein [Spirochaetota bacterium]